MEQQSIEKQQVTGLKLFNTTIVNPKTQEYLSSVLGERKNSFISNITALISSNSALQECAPMSILYAGIRATALDLPLDSNMGFAYVIPYGKGSNSVAQFQIGYKGFIQLALRSGQFKNINVSDVRDGEIRYQNVFTGEIDFNMLDNRDSLKIIGYVAYFKLLNGFEKTLYMSIKEIELHGKKYSQTYKKGFGKWVEDFDKMAQKTVLKLLLSKYAPLSVDMQDAIKSDQSVITENSEYYIDNTIDIEVKPEAVEKLSNMFNGITDIETIE